MNSGVDELKELLRSTKILSSSAEKIESMLKEKDIVIQALNNEIERLNKRNIELMEELK